MIGLLQRVREARVRIAGEVGGEIDGGLLLLVCAERGDTELQAEKLLTKLLKLRIFSDEQGKMNLSLQDRLATAQPAGLLIVSQFTLAADTSGGNRPSLTQAAPPAEGARLYDALTTTFYPGAEKRGEVQILQRCHTHQNSLLSWPEESIPQCTHKHY